MVNKYNNPRLLNTVLTGPGMGHPRNPHVAIGSQSKGFVEGDLMDANAVMENIQDAVDSILDGVSVDFDTLKEVATELDKKQPTLISGTNIKTIDGQSIVGGGNLDVSMLSVTYEELVAMCDECLLVPGRKYRITNYVTRTIQENTKSALHKFDVIVTAIDENTLDENASACLHDFSNDDSDVGDGYFDGGDIQSWLIKYNLYNDISKYKWVVTSGFTSSGGTAYSGENGEVYRLKEFDDGNTTGMYTEYQIAWGTGADDPSELIYTQSENINDGDSAFNTLTGEIETVQGVFSGTGIIYYMKDKWNNECPYDFKNIQFLRNVRIEDDVQIYDEDHGEPTFLYTFNAYDKEGAEQCDASNGAQCAALIDDSTIICGNNTINNYYTLSYGQLTLNDIVFLNTFDIDAGHYFWCTGNVLSSGCCNLTFGNDCRNNKIIGSIYTLFGNDCSANRAFELNYSNIGNFCCGNIIDPTCNWIKFGDNCCDNIIRHHCESITFADGVWCVIVGGCNHDITLTCTLDSTQGRLLNIEILPSCNTNPYGTTITITHPTRNDAFVTVYGDSRAGSSSNISVSSINNNNEP